MTLKILVLLFLGTLVFGETYPPGWENYILLDQLSNIATRRNETLKPAETQIVPVYHVDVPREQIHLSESRFSDKATRQRVFIQKNGKSYIRFYFTEAAGFPLDELKKLNLPIESTHWGTKMQSHSTFLVWEKQSPKPEPFFLKIAAPHWIDNGVRNSEVAETILRKNGNSFATLFRESIGTSFKLGNIGFGNAFREAKPLAMSPTAELAPVHGLLGSREDLLALAQARGLKNADEWIQREYLPKLAEFIAQMQFRHGLYLPAHTQNLVLQINRKTGKIEGFAGRDMVDVILDPFVLGWRGTPSPIKAGKYPGSVLFKSYVDGTDAKNPGYHLASFTAQSVVDITLDPTERQIYAGTFLDAYRKAAEKETGMDFKLSGEAGAAIAALKSGKDPAAHSQSKDTPEPEATFVLLGQELYTRVAEARGSSLSKTPLVTAKAKGAAEATFFEYIYRQKVVQLKPGQWAVTLADQGNLDYQLTETGILAYPKGSPDPIAFVYDLDAVYHDAILAANIPAEGVTADPVDRPFARVSPRCRGARRAIR